MNDGELDRLLDAWQPPAPPPTLRAGLRARFPRPQRRRLGRPLRWLLALAMASAALAVAMEQSGEPLSDYPIIRVLDQVYEHIAEALEAHRVAALVWWIRQCNPKVYIDGQPAPPLQFGHAGVLHVQVPGDGWYRVTLWGRGLKGWTEAGRIHGSSIEFQAGGKRVVIQCSRAIAGSDAPVYTRPSQ